MKRIENSEELYWSEAGATYPEGGSNSKSILDIYGKAMYSQPAVEKKSGPDLNRDAQIEALAASRRAEKVMGWDSNFLW